MQNLEQGGGHEAGSLAGDRQLSREAHQGSFLMRPLLLQGEQWLLEPVRPEEAAIPLDLEVFDRSGLFGVVVHAVHHLGKPRLRKI
jgi:DNA polymerase V